MRNALFVLSAVVGALACTSTGERAEGGGLADTQGTCPTELAACALGTTVTSSGVAFRVWAPDAERASVVGIFNAWTKDVAPMTRLGDGTYAALIAAAHEGDAYKYVFAQHGEELWRSDPRALRLVEGDHENAVVASVTPPAARFSPPSWASAVLYELHVPSFSTDPAVGHGTFRSTIGKLEELVKLGVNAIELMPLHENPGETGWGYGPESLFAIESGYGTPEDLRALVDAAHARNLAVLVDWVPNHMIGGNVLEQFDTSQGLGPYFYPDDRKNTPWGPRPDYREPGVRAYVQDSLATWIERFGFDGARTDSTVGMRQNPGGDLPEAWTLLQDLNTYADRVCPACLIVAEDLQNSDWINRPVSAGGAGFDAQWNEDFFWSVYDAVRTPDDGARDVGRIAGALRQTYLGNPFTKVLYAENHDKVPSDRQKRLPVAISPEDPTDYYARKRSTLAATLLLTAPGIPMLFQGEEFLESTPFDFPNPAALDWTKRERFAGVWSFYHDVIALRRNLLGTTPGLSSPRIDTHHVNAGDHVLAYLRGGDGTDPTLVIVNVANRSYESYLVGVPAGGTWHVRLNTDARAYGADYGDVGGVAAEAENVGRDGQPFRISVPLAPYSALVLSR